MTNEEKSIIVGQSKVKLKKRLMETKSVLSNEARKLFRNAKFDFENKRLIGDGYFLQWELRNEPDKPESYYNQQTSVGTVIIIKENKK